MRALAGSVLRTHPIVLSNEGTHGACDLPRSSMGPRVREGDGVESVRRLVQTSGSAVVSLIRCSAKLDFTSATAGWLNSVCIMNREKWSMSSTCTLSR